MITDVLASISVWVGTVVGVLKILDWLLSQRQKQTLASWAIAVWVWLDDQRLGRFVSAVQSVRTQQLFSLVAHILVAFASLAFLGRAFLGWAGSVEIYIGTPRLHLFQVWVDVAAIFLSMMLLSFVLHTRITKWISGTRSVSSYFMRAGLAAILSYLLFQLYIRALFWLGLPAGQGVIDGGKFLGPAFFAPGTDGDYGGRLNVIILHAVTAIVGAPLLIETLLLITISLCSMCWLLFVWMLSGLHIVSKFLVLRIAEHKDGPILALSALLEGSKKGSSPLLAVNFAVARYRPTILESAARV
ncbi:MAG: hypothetical protein HYU31_20180 [Deltaproteobacteria bacterium]|nr:hypothetical protein [Deltaproteobacteria bacterium]